MPAARQIGDNRLCWTGWFKIASAIRKTDYAIGVRDIDVTGTWSRRPERDTEWLVKIRRKYADVRLSAGLGEAQHADPAGSAFSNEDVAARRNPDQARIVETSGDKLDDKARRHLRPGIGGTRQDARAVVGAGCRIWWRHVRRGNLTSHPRRIAAPIAICCDAGQHGRGLTNKGDCGDADHGCRPNADRVCRHLYHRVAGGELRPIVAVGGMLLPGNLGAGSRSAAVRGPNLAFHSGDNWQCRS